MHFIGINITKRKDFKRKSEISFTEVGVMVFGQLISVLGWSPVEHVYQHGRPSNSTPQDPPIVLSKALH